mgnify:CR=1 FL=1
MGIKDLFDKGVSLSFVKAKSQDDLHENVESPRYVTAYSKQRSRHIPDVDFTDAANFAKFGLAEEYYDAAIKRIYQTYPYDGSSAEKTEWENESTYLDLFIFENEYPRTTGHVAIGITSSFVGSKDSTYNVYNSTSPEYVFIKGGPHGDAAGDYKSEFSAGPSKTGISKANIYNTASQRTNNLELDPSKGVTTEFWLKKQGWASTSEAHNEYLFHLWNSGSVEGAAAGNGSLRAYLNGESTTSGSLFIKAVSGSTELSFTHDTGLTDIADSKWHHYAFTVKTIGTKTKSELYIDGSHKSTQEVASTISPVDGTMIATLGSLAGPLSGSTAGFTLDRGWGAVVSSSFDEFRYWKTRRDAQQIGRFFRDQVGGGTNTDNIKYDDQDKKVDLGVYYKFNEGITGDPTTDSSVLDYSGRISNGELSNYSVAMRSTGSAIILSNAATREFKDPIIYSNHPDVASLKARKKASGSMHDYENSVSIYKSLPGWILEEDEKESNNLKYLTQVLASYFDDMSLQIEKLNTLKDINYPDDTSYEKPLPFAERLLSSRGFDAPRLFENVSELSKYTQRDEKKLFDKKLHEVKNIIYQNIYNNLSYIQKSKGTFKSLRNFLRCFGVDEELVKLNIYSNNDTYEFKDNVSHVAVRKNYIDFDDAETRLTSSGDYGGAYSATAYQYYDTSDSNSISYIPAAASAALTGGMLTVETEVIFPKRSINNEKTYDLFPALTSSIFGMKGVGASNTDLTTMPADASNFNIVAIRSDNDRRNVRFGLVTSGSSVFSELQNTSSYKGTYDNEKWNLAFRLRPSKARTDTGASLNTSTGFLLPAASAYTYELYGVNYVSNLLQNEFVLSGTISLANATTFFTAPKRVFVGAARENFTGSTELLSDVKISSTRVWLDYLPNETIHAHARDPNSYGALQPYRNSSDALSTNYVPQISNLILNWTMDNLTGSDAAGQFLIQDFASGSGDDLYKTGDSWAKPLSRYNYSGRGDKFVADATYADQAIDVEFVHSAKQKLPEIANSDDMVKILDKQDDIVFTKETNYIQHLLSVEKSMYQTISEEMLRLFATIGDFNNLVGEPVNRYRPYYKKLEKLRQLFFLNVQNERLDLEKFIEYFKWIDSAVTSMIAQLIPASSNTTDILRNMVESHILERNKYWTKFPTLEVKTREPVSSLRGINELKYNWKFGHAPLQPNAASNQDENCLWWKQRAERDGILSSGDSGVDTDKNQLLKIIITEASGSGTKLKSSSGTKYDKTFYYNRSLSRVYDLTSFNSLQLKGGSNSKENNIHDFYKSVIKWGSDDDFVYLDIDNETKSAACDDKEIPDEINKKKFNIRALTMPAGETSDSNAAGTGKNDLKYTDAKSSLLLPFAIYSSSVDTGYQKMYSDQYKIDFTNLHDDKYGLHAEIPLQGPFTEKHVGGMQHRHVALNTGVDTAHTREEGWHLEFLLNNTTSGGEKIIQNPFIAATTTATTDTTILSLPLGSDIGDPSEYEYWRNNVGTDNPWTFLKGPTPSAGTGPSGVSQTHAYCEVLPSKVGQTFGMVTPLIDALDLDASTDILVAFSYNMFGLGMGTLKVQASSDPYFETGVQDLVVLWTTPSSHTDTYLAGQQHTDGAGFGSARISSHDHGLGLQDYIGKRFYLRFLYTAGSTHLGDCAIGTVTVTFGSSEDIVRNSFKLLNPTYDNHNRPSAIYTRGLLAKRPVNIKNIHTTGSSPTTAGNYFNRYEYVNVCAPEGNDPYFVKNNAQITQTTMRYNANGIQNVLNSGEGSVDGNARLGHGIASGQPVIYSEYSLPDRTFLTGSTRNRTRIKTRFSSPGGFETLSRGHLDPAHETMSPNNAMTFRNAWVRKVHNSQLQAHCGKFGVSSHLAFSNTAFAMVSVFSHGSANGMTEKEHVTITSSDGTKKRYVITNAASDGSTETGTVLAGGSTDTGAGTAGAAEDGGIAVSINLSSATQNDFLVQLKAAIEHANGHNGKIIVTMPVAGRLSLIQQIVGSNGNKLITTDISQVSLAGFAGGSDGTARVYGSEAVGAVTSDSYHLSGDASKHKYHKNNLERLKYIGSGDMYTDGSGFITASMNDNAFISHMIPRTDQQTRWITASII